MKKVIPFIMFILATFLWQSCAEEFDMSYQQSGYRYLVVEGRITNESKQHEIKLTRTDNVDSGEPVPAILDAKSYILRNGSDTIHMQLRDDTSGVYLTDEFAGHIGDEYLLHVEAIGEIFEGKTTLEPVTKLDSVFYQYYLQSFFGFQFGVYVIRIGAYEPATPGNHYYFNLYLDDTLYNDRMDLTAYSNDQGINGIYLDTIDIYGLPQEEVIRDSMKITLEMLSITKGEYEFINIFLTESVYSGSPFSGPPADIPSNIKCITNNNVKGMGYFSASALERKSIMLYAEHDTIYNDPEYER